MFFGYDQNGIACDVKRLRGDNWVKGGESFQNMECKECKALRQIYKKEL